MHTTNKRCTHVSFYRVYNSKDAIRCIQPTPCTSTHVNPIPRFARKMERLRRQKSSASSQRRLLLTEQLSLIRPTSLLHPPLFISPPPRVNEFLYRKKKRKKIFAIRNEAKRPRESKSDINRRDAFDNSNNVSIGDKHR